MGERIDGKTAEEWNNEGYTHRRFKRYKEALRCYNNALMIDPHYARALNNKGFVLEELGRCEEARRCYDRALEIDDGAEPLDALKIEGLKEGVLIDSFAWLEILKGSKRGKSALEIIDRSEKSFISVLNLYELRQLIEEIKDEKTAEEYIRTIKSHTRVLDIDEEIALKAAMIKSEHKMSDIDALILATARVHNLKILTGDETFKGIDEAVLV
ncbi:MAG: tetratricopeptide repeat protein [Halobacteriota archaeon]|nr:tetratricopeptide repeat protein [Halobacteriota archaeon]